MAEKIRNFFKKKKVDKEFKSAGPGHRLCEESHVSSKPSYWTNPSSSNKRYEPTEGVKKAGEAALARIQQQQQTQNPNWSQAAIRAQARKEIELELQVKEKEKHKQDDKVSYTTSAPVLAVSGVYFSCPLIGPVVSTYNEIEEKIKDYLYEQLYEDRIIVSSLIIKSCNKDREKVKIGVDTICKYFKNIIDNPEEEKYRKIKMSNKIFQERIVTLEGSWDFFISAGFQQETLEKDDAKEDYLVFPKDNTTDTLEMATDILKSAEPVLPQLDRSIRVLMPSASSIKINLPDEFFGLSAEELRKEQEERTSRVELLTQLRTKEMRERDEKRHYRYYKYTLIRIRFPDGILLQGTFYSHETLKDIKEFLNEHLLNTNVTYTLLAPGGTKLTNEDDTLRDLQLSPAAVLNLHTDEQESEDEKLLLKPETKALVCEI
ncbi:UBX domain-containing protein 6 [Centruroides vittatus]|uniref:UBX domain-containing protein 6 n=1 Tax=Centruroides vittatus TaxID=120091 RepID=UPI00350F6CB1